MTEKEWLECVKPGKMLHFLRKQEPSSARKPRLFACACCRQIWHLLPDERSRKAVEVAECYADGLVSNDDLRLAQDEALSVDPSGLDSATDAVSNAAEHVDDPPPIEWVSAEGAAEKAWFAVAEAGPAKSGPVVDVNAFQVAILRDMFGNPFKPLVFERAWLTSAVKQLAESIYVERAVGLMPILADALEDAGCTSEDILSHCRQSPEHVRGCWVVDLLLNKK